MAADNIEVALQAIVGVGSLVTALLFGRASLLKIRDSQDHFIIDLQRIAWWNGTGAFFAFITALAILTLWAKATFP
jgi:hypothetical protein